jgi:hypothetical protein
MTFPSLNLVEAKSSGNGVRDLGDVLGGGWRRVWLGLTFAPAGPGTPLASPGRGGGAREYRAGLVPSRWEGTGWRQGRSGIA